MNPTSMGNLIKSGLLALGVSSTILGYVSNEVWVALGGVVIAVGAGLWQLVSLKTKKIIEAAAASPEVAKIVVHDAKLADAIPSPKVVKLHSK